MFWSIPWLIAQVVLYGDFSYKPLLTQGILNNKRQQVSSIYKTTICFTYHRKLWNILPVSEELPIISNVHVNKQTY